jgi:mercuric ion binding protein
VNKRSSWLGLGIAVMLAWGSAAWSQTKPITVHVMGMVCQFCAQGIEKKFKAKAEIESVHVDMEKKEVHLALKDGKDLTDLAITEAIRDAGVNVERIVR